MKIAQGSRLSGLLPPGERLEMQVNSSHHQAVREPGDKLLVSAVSPEDGVIEAVELDAADHFVLGVQWHPERTYTQSACFARDLCGLCAGGSEWQAPRIEESVVRS